MKIFKKKLSIEETNINIVSDIDINSNFNNKSTGNSRDCNKGNNLYEFILNQRNQLKEYIANNPLFAKTLSPYTPSKSKPSQSIPKIIEMMINSSNIANVGPTATIAGTIAELSLDYLINQGSKYSILDNGGDIAFLNDYKNKNLILGIYAGNSPLSGKIGLKFKSKNKNYPMGVCSSSGSVGYSISYGRSDCVTVIANHASVADGLATSIANEVNGKLDFDAVENGLAKAEEFKESFFGVLIIVGESVGTIGKVPIVETKDNSIFSNFENEY